MADNKRRLHYLPMACAVCLAVLMAVFSKGCGCGSSDPGKTVPLQEGAGVVPAPAKFNEWPEPQAALVISGELHGYIEPCGCSETQSGGLARRADLLRQLQEKKWPVAGVDLGGSLKPEKTLDTQGKHKLQLVLDSLHDMGYPVYALGPEELKSGPDFLISSSAMQQRMSPDAQGVKPAFLGANTTIYGSPALGPGRGRVMTVGDVKVGVTATIGESHYKKLFPDGSNTGITFETPEKALAEVVKTFADQKTEWNLLLSHGSLDEAKALAKEFPQFQIVVSAEGGEEPDGEPIQVGDTLILQVGKKGKHAGVLAYYPPTAETEGGDSAAGFQFELIELDNHRFKNSTMIEKRLREYQAKLKTDIAEIIEKLPMPVNPGDAEYVGAETCGECHKKAYAKWSKSKHAHAYESLKTGREGQYSEPLARTHDVECLACHVTGWEFDPQIVRHEGGFLPEELAAARNQPELYTKRQGQQCENCHGRGSTHVAWERKWFDDRDNTDKDTVLLHRAEIRIKKDEAKKNLCIKCHDLENSPKFEFDAYWEKIQHPFVD